MLYACWGAGTLPLVGYAVATSVWQLMILAALFGAMITIGLIIFVTLQNTRVPRDMRGPHPQRRPVHLDRPGAALVRAHRAGGRAARRDTTLIIAGIAPTILIATLFFVFRIRQEEIPVPGITGPAGASRSSPRRPPASPRRTSRRAGAPPRDAAPH